MIDLEIWASGAGTNAEKIIEHFKGHPEIGVVRVCSTNAGAGVMNIAKTHLIDRHVLSSGDLNKGAYLNDMKRRGVDFIILAGFLKLVPPSFIQAYRERILNIHPALLPKYGGKNMYGDHVHKAVLAAKEKESGISIHLVNEKFDEGPVIAQFPYILKEHEDLDSLRSSIRSLEHKYYPDIIEAYATKIGPIL